MLTSFVILGFIAVLSGVIAFLGNQLGRYIGKKKMSILKLRPRYTSILFTVITGSLISLLSIGILTIFSTEARRVVFELEKLEKERKTMIQELYYMNVKMQKADVIFNINEPICIGVMEGGGGEDQVKEQLDRILASANKLAVDRNNLKALRYETAPISENEKVVGYFPEEYRSLIQQMAYESGSWVVIAYSAQNAFFKDKVGIKFNLIPNRLIFKKNQEITRAKIEGELSNTDVQLKLTRLLGTVRSQSLQKGVIADPVSGDVGNISMGVLLDIADKIKALNGPVYVVVLANTDIYTAGPMDVRFLIKPILESSGREILNNWE